MMRDTLSVQVLLKSYGKEKGYDIDKALSHVIFYYGKTSIPKPFSILGTEMDEHFNWQIFEQVEEVNNYFRSRLFSILAGGS